MSAPTDRVETHGPLCKCLDCQVVNAENEFWREAYLRGVATVAARWISGNYYASQPRTRLAFELSLAADVAHAALLEAKKRDRL